MGRLHWRCCVIDCIGSRVDKNEIKVREGVSFYRVPKVIENQDEKTKKLSAFRRKKWIAVLRLKDITEYTRVCSKHFYSGAPSKLYDQTNPDWIPNNLKSLETCGTPSTVTRYERKVKRSKQQSLTPISSNLRKGVRSVNATSTPYSRISSKSVGRCLMEESAAVEDCETAIESTTLGECDAALEVEPSSSFKNPALSSSCSVDSGLEATFPLEDTAITINDTIPFMEFSIEDSITKASLESGNEFSNLSINFALNDTNVRQKSIETQTESNVTDSGIHHPQVKQSVSQRIQTDANVSNISQGIQTDKTYFRHFDTQTEKINSRHFDTQTEPNIIDHSIQTQTIIRVCYKFELESAETELKECKEVINNLNSQLEAANNKNKNLLDQINKQNSEIKRKEDDLGKFKFNPSYFRGDADKILFFTGLTSFEYILDLVEEIEAYLFKNSKLSPFQQFILTVMKLRLASSNKDLAYRFWISESAVGRIFYNCLNAMFNRLYKFVKWPERDELQATMPICFREKFGKKCAVIIDCFEVFSDKPSSVRTQAETFSSYKHHNTVKFLIGVTPQGSISFISKGWGGRVSDKYLTECSGILDKLVPGDLVLADRGFDIDDAVGFYCATIKYPTFLNGKKQLDPLDVEATRKLANVRIHVERVIGQLRQKYSILHTTIPTEFLRHAPNEKVSTIDKICTVCCALTNLTPSVVPIE